MSKWHKGPPPSVGWWPASMCEDTKMVRWWNGKKWSAATKGDVTGDPAKAKAREAWYSQSDIKWLPRPASWPKRSRT